MKYYLLAAFSALFIFACGEVGEDGSSSVKCNGKEIDSSKEFCVSNETYPLCPDTYNPTEQICFFNELFSWCSRQDTTFSMDCDKEKYKLCGNNDIYDLKMKFCDNDVLYDLCGGNPYKYDEQFCGSKNENGIEKETIRNMCKTKPCGETPMGVTIYCLEKYNDTEFVCVGAGNKLEKIDNNKISITTDTCTVNGIREDFDISKFFCDRNSDKPQKVYPMCGGLSKRPDECCNGIEYKASTQFCYGNELYPNCNVKKKNGTDSLINIDNYPKGNIEYPYNPQEFVCFEGNKLYPNCKNQNSRGTCVDNTLLRCRQEGKGDNYIRDPLPGMRCLDKDEDKGNYYKKYGANIGAIVGTTQSGYGVAQIGKQIWLRENLKRNSDYGPGNFYSWAEANNLSLYCNLDDKNECNRISEGRIHDAWCPPGFYMPSDKEWEELMEYAGGASVAGGRLKSQDAWKYDGYGTDNYGFSAKPEGYYEGILDVPLTNGKADVDYRAMWWSATHASKVDGNYWTIISSDTELRSANQNKGMYRVQVRCMYYYDRKN